MVSLIQESGHHPPRRFPMPKVEAGKIGLTPVGNPYGENWPRFCAMVAAWDKAVCQGKSWRRCKREAQRVNKTWRRKRA